MTINGSVKIKSNGIKGKVCHFYINPWVLGIPNTFFGAQMK